MVNTLRLPLTPFVFFVLCITFRGDYRPPAKEKPTVLGREGSAILPGGRVLQPAGSQFPTGAGASKIATSLSGKRIATANLGPERPSVTIVEEGSKSEWSVQNFGSAVSGGIAFASEKSLWVSESTGGSVRLIDTETGSRKKSVDLGEGSISGDLALDSARNLLLVVDQGRSRVVVFETHHDKQVGEVAIESRPEAICLIPGGKRAYVITAGALVALDIADAASPKIANTIEMAHAASLLAANDALYISNAVDDCIEVIDPATGVHRQTIPLRIPGLESLRGIRPMGMAYDESRHWLLVAEAGINAVGVIDVSGGIKGEVLGHLPVGGFPTSLSSTNGTVVVANAKGNGTGPSSDWRQDRGSISRFILPAAGDLAKPTHLVLAMNGLLEVSAQPHPNVPVHHVVIVLKGSRTFDDILGDVTLLGSSVAGRPALARFGNAGYADGRRSRLSLQQIPITPNHHALAQQFTLSDNFYVDSIEGLDDLAKHLERQHVSFLEFGEAFDGSMSDQSRVSRLISDLDSKYRNSSVPFPQVILLHLPNDRTGPPRPQDGYPYAASYAADNDLALGRVVDYFSHSPWWREMAIFATEGEAGGGRDHIDLQRTVFLGIGPWFRKGFCSHVNANFAAVLKSTFQMLRVPPMRLSDAAAADLGEMFTAVPDYGPYLVQPIDPRLVKTQ